MKNSKKLLTVIGLFYLAIYACIPIEDVVPPQIGNFGLEENTIYYYQDTIKFEVVYIDNALLDSIVITVSKSATELSTPNDWDTTMIFAGVQGRRYEREEQLVVPKFKTPGRYDMNITVFDQGGNNASSTRSFLLQQDITLPVFHDLQISLPQQNDGSYQACRSEIVGIQGGVSDNLSVSRIGFEFGAQQSDAVAVSADSLDISNFFGSSVVVPSNVPNGNSITLTIFAVDTFQNRIEQDFIINIACDDEPPVVNIAKTTPSLNANLATNVAQGARFTIDSLVVSDNEFLRSATIYFNTEGEALKELYQIPLNTSRPVDLADSVNLVFNIGQDEAIGLTRVITIAAVDSSGNEIPPVEIRFSVIEDVAPVILITNTYINRVETTWSTTEATSLNTGDVVNFDGKVEELNRLTNLIALWGEENAPNTVINLTEFASLPVNLAGIQDERTFRVPNNAEIGSVYILSLSAVDSRGQETSVRYRFRIEQ